MATHTSLPSRAAAGNPEHGYISDDEAVPKNNPTDTTELLTERLQAWKHMCGYLEGYVSEVAKDQKGQAKDQEKILKSLSHPLREGHHFDQALGGVSGLFENLRASTQAQISLHGETSKSLTGTVSTILERLHAEIKSKAKELEKGAGKGSKAVQAARDASQKHIELMGQHTATFDASGTKTTANTDPYVLQKQVMYRLNKQLVEENDTRGDLIAVQNSFKSFEAHVVQTIQQALAQFNQLMAGQADRQKLMYADISNPAAKMPLDFEWNGFLHRNSDKLIDPNAPRRTIDTVSFPNQGHRATQALIEGTLERKKSGLGGLGGYSQGFFAISPAGYLHEFKDNDNLHRDPSPESSLYLPDCMIGAVDGVKFSVKGKDTSGGKLSQKMASNTEYSFKANSPQDALQWHSIINAQTNVSSTSTSSSLPTSPVAGTAGTHPTTTPAAPATVPAAQHTAAPAQTTTATSPVAPTTVTQPTSTPAGAAPTTAVPATAATTTTPTGTTTVLPGQAI